MKRIKNPLFIFIVILVIICVLIDFPRIPIKIHFWKINIETAIAGPDINLKLFGKTIHRELNIKQGLDLQGGTHLVLETDMTSIPQDKRSESLEGVRRVIERRINFYGVSEPTIQTAQVGESYRVIIELPGVQDISQAISLIGQTAKLEFREFSDDQATSTYVTFPTLDNTISTGLTGSDLKKSQVDFNQQTGEPYIAIEFTQEGAVKFSELTTRLVGKSLPIFLDDVAISWPVVQEPIPSGNAQISGEFTLEAAKNLAYQLEAGALPVPVKGIIEQRNVGATLGQESVKKSVWAGLIGLGLVIFFMTFYYGKYGLFADLALVIYGLLTMAIYRLIPVTMTLSGVAGFILSIGMAVDSNILIFERIKEEIRWGKPKSVAIELGFGRAWDSIRDANVATLITCFILFNPFRFSFLNVSGPIRGFALTLALGIFCSLFTGIVVTRTLLRMGYRKN